MYWGNNDINGLYEDLHVMGDSGTTGIHGGMRVPKTDIRIETNGTLDELNSIIGIVRSFLDDAEKDNILREIQVNLMTAMSIVALLLNRVK